MHATRSYRPRRRSSRALTHVANWVCAAGLGFALASAHHLDRDAHEHHAQAHGWAVDQATTLGYAKAIAAREHRMELEAMRMCGSEHATVVWLDGGGHRCQLKNGRVMRRVHQVGAL